MACSIKEIKENSLEEVKKVFINNATSYIEKGNTVSIPIGNKWNKQTAYNIAKSGVNRVEKWAKEKFGKDIFSNGWANISTYYNDKVVVTFMFPPLLEKAYLAKNGVSSVDTVNKEAFQIEEENIISEGKKVEVKKPESETFNSIISNPQISDEEVAKGIFLNIFSEKFKKKFGDWENNDNNINKALLNEGGEPKMFYLTPNGTLTTDYKIALQNTNGGEIEMGFVSTDDINVVDNEESFNSSLSDFSQYKGSYKLNNKDSFISVAKIDSSSSLNTKSGFINKAIRQGVLSQNKKRDAAGEYKLYPSGLIPSTKIINIIKLKQAATLTIGEIKVLENKDGSVSIEQKVEDPLIEEVYNDIQNGKLDVAREKVGNLGSFLFHRWTKRRSENGQLLQPTSNKEKTALTTKFLTLLKNLGISTTTITEYVKNYKVRNGVDLSVNAIADVANNVVAFASDNFSEEDLVEETAHIIIESYTNQSEINAILKDVEQTEMWSQYADEYYAKYSKMYEGEELDNAVRKEILGKILAEEILNKFQESQTPQNILSKLLEVLNSFINNIKAYFNPSTKTNLDLLIDSLSDISLRDNAEEFLDEDLLGKSPLVLYSINNTAVKNNVNIGLKKVALLEKMKQTLESRKNSQVKIGDRETQSIKIAINQTIKAINENDDRTAGLANIAYHESLIGALERKLKAHTDATPFFDHATHHTYTYLQDTAEPIMVGFMSLFEKTEPKISKQISDLLSRLTNLKAKLQDQNQVDSQTILEHIKGKTELSDKESETILQSMQTEQKDITMLQKMYNQLEHVSNTFLNYLGRMISDMYWNAEQLTRKEFFPLLDEAVSKKWSINSFRNITKRNKEGKKTGYLLAEKNQGAWDEDYNNFIKDFLSKLTITPEQRSKFTGGLIPMSLLTPEQKSEYRIEEQKWFEEHNERAMTDEYYRQKEAMMTEAGVGDNNRSRLSEWASRSYNIKRKYIDAKGKIDFLKFTYEDKMEFAQISKEKKLAKSSHDSFGEPKKGDELKEAEELIAYDNLRAEKAKERGDRGLTSDFMNALIDVENTQGREAAYNFLVANGGINFSDGFWNSFKNQSTQKERVDKYIAEEEAKGLDVSHLVHNSEGYFNSVEARKALLKQYTTANNPSEIEMGVMPQRVRDRVLELEDDISSYLIELNTALKDGKQSLVPTALTETTVNEAYKTMLEEYEGDELSFIESHLSETNKRKVGTAKRELNYFMKGNSSYLSKVVRNFLENTYQLYSDEDIRNFINSSNIDNVITDYARKRVASYFKRFAPEGYDEQIEDLKNGNKSVVEFVNEVNLDSNSNFKISTRFEWADLEDENSMVNPLYALDTESGFNKPKMSLYRDEEYFNKFNPVNGVATTNIPEWEMIQKLKGVKRAILTKYDTDGNVNKLPMRRRQRSERLLNPNLRGAKQSIMDAVTNRQDDMAYGEQIDGKDVLDETGIKIIPRPYLNNLKNLDEVSDDFLYTYGTMLREANLYQERIKGIGEALSVRQSLLQSTFKGGKAPSNTNVLSMLDERMDAFFYGIKSSAKAEMSIFGRKVDFSQVLNNIESWTRSVNIKYNLPVAVSSAVLSNINVAIEKGIGGYLNKDSAKWARMEMAKLLPSYSSNYGNVNRQDKLYLLGERFGVHQVDDKLKNASYNKIIKGLSDSDYAFMSLLSQPHINTVLLTALDDFRLVGDRFITFKEFKNRASNNTLNSREIKDAWKEHKDNTVYNLLDNVGGVLQFKQDVIDKVGQEYADSTLKSMSGVIQRVIGNVDGLISSDDRNAASRHYLANYTTTHAGFLTLGLQRAFKRQHFNQRTLQMEEGYYRSTFKLMTDIASTLQADKFRNFLKVVRENWHLLDDYQKVNVKRVGVQAAVFMILTAMSVLVANYDDDDKNKDEWAIHFLSFLYFKTTSEMGTTQLPFGALDFVERLNRPFQAIGTIKKLKDDVLFLNTDIIDKGVFKGDTKLEAALIRQTWLRQWYDMQDIKKKSDGYRFFNNDVLMFAQKPKKADKVYVEEAIGGLYYSDKFSRGE